MSNSHDESRRCEEAAAILQRVVKDLATTAGHDSLDAHPASEPFEDYYMANRRLFAAIGFPDAGQMLSIILELYLHTQVRSAETAGANQSGEVVRAMVAEAVAEHFHQLQAAIVGTCPDLYEDMVCNNEKAYRRMVGQCR